MHKENVRYIRPVEQYERYDEPEDCTVYHAVILLVVTAIGAGVVLVCILGVML